MIKIFLDMDGVLADFATSFENEALVSLKDAPYRVVRSYLDNSTTLFRDAPVLPGAHELYEALLEIDPNLVLLSSMPYNNFYSSYTQKIEWMKEHFSASPNILKPVFEEVGKYPLAKDRCCVLIDDYNVHTSQWQHKGSGTSILYTEQPVQEIVDTIKAIPCPH